MKTCYDLMIINYISQKMNLKICIIINTASYDLLLNLKLAKLGFWKIFDKIFQKRAQLMLKIAVTATLFSKTTYT